MSCSHILIEGKLKKITTRKDGYQLIYLNGKLQYLHRFLAQKYLPNPNNLPCINHIDGNKSNNELKNLEWVSYYENNHHAKHIGLWGKNIKKKMKLDLEKISIAKKLYQTGEYTYKNLAKKFDVDYRTIYNAINNKTYQKKYILCS